MSIDDDVSDARVVEVLTAHAPLSDYCLVGGSIYSINCQARWGRLLMKDDATFAAACRLLARIGVPQFATEDEWMEWVIRTIPVAGGLWYDDQSYRFTEAFCTWRSEVGLSVKAIGTDCKLDFADIPFVDAKSVSDLEGRSWPPVPWEGIRRAALAPTPWTVEAGGKGIRVVALEIDCGACRVEPATLNVFFQGTALHPGSSNERDISGSLYCRVVPC